MTFLNNRKLTTFALMLYQTMTGEYSFCNGLLQEWCQELLGLGLDSAALRNCAFACNPIEFKKMLQEFNIPLLTMEEAYLLELAHYLIFSINPEEDDYFENFYLHFKKLIWDSEFFNLDALSKLPPSLKWCETSIPMIKANYDQYYDDILNHREGHYADLSDKEILGDIKIFVKKLKNQIENHDWQPAFNHPALDPTLLDRMKLL